MGQNEELQDPFDVESLSESMQRARGRALGASRSGSVSSGEGESQQGVSVDRVLMAFQVTARCTENFWFLSYSETTNTNSLKCYFSCGLHGPELT